MERLKRSQRKGLSDNNMNVKKMLKRAEKEAVDLNKARDKRCIPMAIEFMKAMAEHDNHKIGDVKDRMTMLKAYEPVARQMLQKYLDHGISPNDAQFIFQIALQGFEAVGHIITETTNNHTRTIQEKVFGDMLNDLTYYKLDTYLADDKIE